LEALNSPEVEVRFWAIFALGLLRAREAIAPLAALVEEDSAALPEWGSIREEAASALDAIRHPAPAD
jgi:HEAT repeat protein